MAAIAPALPWISAAMSVGGTIMSAVSARNEGKALEQGANYEAQQLDAKAGQERASAIYAAQEDRRQKRLAQSRAQAVAASGGGMATDSDVLDIMGDLEKEGEFRAMTRIYEGEERARGMETDATLRRYEGKQSKRAGNTKATATILSGATSLFDRFDDRARKTPSYR